MADITKNFLYLIMVISILRLLSPSKEYDKYIKFFISLLLVISILTPILTIVKKGEFSSLLNDSYVRIDTFESQINEGKIDTDSLIIDEYKNKLNDNIKGIINKKYYIESKVSVRINEDSNSDTYGDIKEINITLNENDIKKKDKIKSYLSKTYLVDLNNINIKTGSVE
ncbi:stage III sporulation protein AF [Anaerofustis stercorihominis]|uniref:stage III sporulation protein AF n=1 Tax=Anaerofustis stercorihominis TaxID=214853 RepID=UPI00214CF507|nr:stage III sporulation protein AF [Anaerofustis stercorihominis]MCR2032072.1 stage III sporulation protein AF [Anaerofustis stercorihominis]